MEFHSWEGAMDEATAAVDELITEATGLVERRAEADDPRTVPLLRDALAAAVATCADTALASDAADVLAQLDVAARRRERRHDLPLAS